MCDGPELRSYVLFTAAVLTAQCGNACSTNAVLGKPMGHDKASLTVLALPSCLLLHWDREFGGLPSIFALPLCVLKAPFGGRSHFPIFTCSLDYNLLPAPAASGPVESPLRIKRRQAAPSTAELSICSGGSSPIVTSAIGYKAAACPSLPLPAGWCVRAPSGRRRETQPAPWSGGSVKCGRRR